MRYAKIVEGTIEQIQPIPQDGFIEVEDDVICGMVDNEDGTFSNPAKTLEQINQERLVEIDIRLDKIDRLTIRSMRSKALNRGNQQDTDTMIALDDEAKNLRTERGYINGTF